MKQIILCADDYAQSNRISEGILDLVRMRRLSAVSCLSESPTWPRDARELRSSLSGQKVGLHFNLTLPFNRPTRSASQLLIASLLGKIDPSMISRAFDQQWHSFIRCFGRPPDFVDGHQHVHTFPIIREVIVSMLPLLQPGCFIRTLDPPQQLTSGPIKQRILEKIAHPLSSILKHHGLSTNPTFAGFRSYHNPLNFRETCHEWLAAASDGTLIMCHPGKESNDRHDPIRRCRFQEFAYLSAEEFITDLLEQQIALA